MSAAFFDEEPVCLFERPKDHNAKNPGPEDKEERKEKQIKKGH